MNRKERDEIRAEVDAEFEAEERELKKGGKKNKRKMPKESLAHEDDLGSLFGDGITGKLPRYANKITMKVSFDFSSSFFACLTFLRQMCYLDFFLSFFL